MCCLVTAAVPDEYGTLWNSWQMKTKSSVGGTWNATPSIMNLTWSHLGWTRGSDLRNQWTGQNVENHYFPSLFFIRFYDFYSLSASLLPLSFLYPSLFRNDYTFAQQFVRNIFEGTSYVEWGTLRKQRTVNSTTSLVGRFWLSSYAENSLAKLCHDDVTIYITFWSWCTLKTFWAQYKNEVRSWPAQYLKTIKSCQSWPSTECLYRFLALLQQESSSNQTYYCALHCWLMVQRAM
jgi:hypothetical protein